jgi:hypothetical protein
MARGAKAPRLKVYRTAMGFDDALVAAPNQKAALQAWGTSTDLFAAGRAAVVDDPAEGAEALAHPGQVVRRPRPGEAELLAEMRRAEGKRLTSKWRRAPTST